MPSQRSDSTSRRRRSIGQIADAYRTAHEIVSGAMALGVLAGGGYWLDKRLGWSPWLMLTGIVLGVLAAGASFVALLQRLDRESAIEKQRRAAERERESL